MDPRNDPQSAGTGLRAIWGKRAAEYLGLVFVGAAAAATVLAATRYGPTISSDSVIYLGAANNLLLGRGLARLSALGQVKPVTHFPPLLPLVLSGSQLLGFNPLSATRWINAGLFAGFVLLVGYAVYAATTGRVTAAAAMLGVLTAPFLVEVFSSVMSEPLFLVLSLAGMLFYAGFLERGRRWLLLAAGVAIGLACLTRYVGSSLLLAVLAYHLLVAGRGRSPRWAELAALAALGFMPLTGWMIRNLALTGSLTNRRLAFHALTSTQLKAPAAVVWAWLSPFKFTFASLHVTVAAVALAAALAARALWHRRIEMIGGLRERSVEIDLPSLIGLYTLTYSVSLIVSLLLLDASTPINTRTAAPIFVNLAILLAVVAHHMLDPTRSPAAGRIVVAALVALLLTSNAVRTVVAIAGQQRGEVGLTAQTWQHGGISELPAVPQDVIVYTNNLEALYFLYGMGGYQVLEPVDPVTRRPRGDYQATLEEVRDSILSGNAVLYLYGRTDDVVPQYPTLTEGLKILAAGADGTLLVGLGYQVQGG